jgi:hypothetical protein
MMRCVGEDLVLSRRMRRSAHLAVALVAVFLLLRPFDCFSSSKFDQKAADCCKKGKCSPSNSDDCCKATIPGGKQLVTAQSTDHSAPVLAVVATAGSTATLQLSATVHFVEIHQAPGSPPDLRLNLPLLI